MSTPDRIIVLSDLHLGRPDGVRRAAELDALLEPGTTLVLNGDTAELHHASYQIAAEEEWARLQEIAADRSIRLVPLSGNHDPMLSRERMLLFGDGRVLVTHGDAFHPAVAPWSESAKAMRAAWERTMHATPESERSSADAVFQAAREAAVAEWLHNGQGASQSTIARLALRPWAFLRIVGYWLSFPRLADEFAEAHAPHATIVVTGHSHRPGRWRVGPRTILNTGSFSFPGRPHAVVLEGDAVALHPIAVVERRGHRRFSLVQRPVATLSVPSATATPARPSRDAGGRPSAAAIARPASSTASSATPVATPERSNA
jgi:predicted phosphodiesterase